MPEFNRHNYDLQECVYDCCLPSDTISMPIQEGSIASVYKGNVQCIGTESSLVDCTGPWTDNYACAHPGHDYAGVKCFAGTYVKLYLMHIVEKHLHMIFFPSCN